MTNTKDSTVNLSYLYPKLLVMPSERYEKFYRERYEAQKNTKNVRSYDDLFPFNPNFGVTEKQKIMMRKLSEGEIVALGMFTTIVTTLTLVPIMSGVNPILVLLLNGIWLLVYAFYAADIVEDNKEHNERTFANVLYPFTATVGITFIMPALLVSLR